MIDFIEYVVGELKSKRLSKSDAVGLIEKFSQGSAAPSAARDLHPLVHCNTSDLTRQKFSSNFSGDEFFLRDHRVQGNRVLPAVAYLEMIRAAMAAAQPGAAGTLGLRHVAWAQPIVVSEPHDVELSLCIDEGQQAETLIDCEIASAGDDVVHFQCQAAFTTETPPQRCDLESLRARMTQRTPGGGRHLSGHCRAGHRHRPFAPGHYFYLPGRARTARAHRAARSGA